MMFLDPDLVLKRVLIVIGCLTVLSGFGTTFYFGKQMYSQLVFTKEATDVLKNETNELKNNLTTNTKDLKSSINVTVEETKKVDVDLKSTTGIVKQYQTDTEKYKSDTKTDITKLRELYSFIMDELKMKERYFNEQLKLRDSVIEKHKSEIIQLQDNLKNKDKELTEIKAKLDKEVEWRNRSFFNR